VSRRTLISNMPPLSNFNNTHKRTRWTCAVVWAGGDGDHDSLNLDVPGSTRTSYSPNSATITSQRQGHPAFTRHSCASNNCGDRGMGWTLQGAGATVGQGRPLLCPLAHHQGEAAQVCRSSGAPYHIGTPATHFQPSAS